MERVQFNFNSESYSKSIHRGPYSCIIKKWCTHVCQRERYHRLCSMQAVKEDSPNYPACTCSSCAGCPGSLCDTSVVLQGNCERIAEHPFSAPLAWKVHAMLKGLQRHQPSAGIATQKPHRGVGLMKHPLDVSLTVKVFMQWS